MNRSRRGPPSQAEQTDFGMAELTPDADRPGCWTLFIDGQPHSHVDTLRPHVLHFEYMRLLALFADHVAAPGVPLRVLHLGGGAMALARYVAVTRPGSAQLVIEHDGALTAFVRRVIPLPRRASIRVRQTTASEAVKVLPRGRFDLVLADIPGLRPETAAQAERILDPRGIYAANVLRSAPYHEHAMQRAFGAVCSLQCGHYGNVVLASRKEIPLPEQAIRRAVANFGQPVKLTFRP